MKKRIVVGEKIVKENVWRGSFVKEEYLQVAERALVEHKKVYPSSNVELIYSFDEGAIAGFDKAKEIQALGVAGYKFSTTAIEAAQLSQKFSIPFVTAVSPVKSVRNPFTLSLAYSHDQLKGYFEATRSRFDNPSVVLIESEHLTNLEYGRIFKETFNVKKVYEGKLSTYADDLRKFIGSYKNQTVNVLLAGYGLSQFDTVNSLFSEFGSQLNFIAHTQWSFCEKILAGGLIKGIENLYAVTDYSNPLSFDGTGIHISSSVLQNHRSFKEYLAWLPQTKTMPLDEPVVYTMMDMMHVVLEAAEKSSTREEFLKRVRNMEFAGFSDEYMIVDGTVRKRVFLVKWNKTGFKPIAVL